jgi:hypothetical protein
MTRMRYTLDGYGAGTSVPADSQTPQSISRKKEELKQDIARIHQMDLDDLNALDDRVFQSLSDTISRIEKFKAEVDSLSAAPTPEQLDWLRRAEYSRLSFVRARKSIHNRKVDIERQKRQEIKKKNGPVAHRLALEQMETARKRQEEKTKRHESVMVRQAAIYKKVMGLIRERGLLTEPEIIQLYRDAEAIVDAQADGQAHG